MGVERAHGEPWHGDAPPLAQRPLGEPSARDHPRGRDLGGHVFQGDVRGDEHDAQRAGREHHRDVRVVGKVSEEFGEAGIAEAGEMQSVLVDRAGDDRVDRALPRERHRAFDGAAGEPAGRGRAGGALGRSAHGHRRLAAPRSPSTDPDLARGRDRFDLFVRPDQRELGFEPCGECLRHHLRPDPAGIAERHREAGTARHRARSGRRRRWCGAGCRGSASRRAAAPIHRGSGP